jgi:hypothetical protein
MESIILYKKKCKACGGDYESTSRNKQKCPKCDKYKDILRVPPTEKPATAGFYKKICYKCLEIYESRKRDKRYCNRCQEAYRIGSSKKSKYRFNEATLEDRGFKSYLLGFLCTDGSSTMKNGIFTQVGWYSSDKEIVDKITERLQYNHSSYLVSEKGKGEWGNSFWADNARLIQNLGLKKDKEYHTLRDMDVDIFPFLRGALDGDGSIIMRQVQSGRVLDKVQFLFRKILADEVALLLESEGFKLVPRERKLTENRTKVLYSVCSGSTNGERLLSKLYENETISLSRKKVLWEEIKKTREIMDY